jgi:hypothetical protein
MLTTEEIMEKHGTGSQYVVRTFTDSVTKEELQAFRTRSESLGYKESQSTHILEGHGWKMKEHGYLPINIERGKDCIIKGSLIKGHDDLVVRIQIT